MKTEIGIKVYADKLAPYINWDVDYFEVYIRHIDHLGQKVTLNDQLEMLKPIQHKVKGIHGGILYQGVNFLNKDRSEDNKKALDIVFESLDFFPNCAYIVFHPGVFENVTSCSFESLFNWIRPINDSRFMIEFEPFFAYKERYLFPLYKVKDWLTIKNEIQKDIVLDTGHALITARALNYEPHTYITDLIDVLQPKVMHIANNDARGDGYEDSHLALSDGELNFSLLSSHLSNKLLTIESNELSFNDVSLLRRCVATSLV